MTRARLLTLDRGNSTLDLLLHGGDARRSRLAPGAPLSSFLAGERPSACVGVTVVAGGLDDAERELSGLGLQLRLVGRDLQCPLPLGYDTPETLGADRWVAALAANRRFGRAVVVDCGSATTVDLVEQDGTFRGGAIAPGLQALMRGLAATVPHLPAADPARGGPLPGRSSRGSIEAGVIAAFCGGIERMVSDVLRAARGPCTVVLTGGHAEDYLRRGRLRPEHVPDLVHRGLGLLAGEVGWTS